MNEKILNEVQRMKSLFNAEHGKVITEVDWGAVGTSALGGAGMGASMGVGVFSVPGAILGGIVGAIGGLLSNQYSSTGAKKILQYCSSQGMGKPTQSRQTLNAIADGINKAVEGLGTDEDAIKSNLEQLATMPDLCAMATAYQTRHGESLMDAIDGDIDDNSEWKKYVFLPLLDIYEKSVELGQKAQQQQAAGGGQAGQVTPRQQNINNMVCSADKNGIINSPSSVFNGKPLQSWATSFKVTPQELQAAKASCGKNQVVTARATGGTGGTRRSTGTRSSGSNSSQRFQQTQKQLNPNSSGKMDAENLQQILKTLESGKSSAPTQPAQPATPAGGQPDLAQLQKTLSQLA